MGIEGGIGAGKTTLLTHLEKSYRVIYEPVDDWLEFMDPKSGKSLFELFYHDKAKYAFAFQMMILETRFDNFEKHLKDVEPGEIVFCERTLDTDLEIFANLMQRKGLMTDIERSVYGRYQGLLARLSKYAVSHIIYLRTNPDVCAERINTRARKGEENMDPQYIIDIHEAHEAWLINGLGKIPVHVVDATENDKSKVRADVERIIDLHVY